jgi:hypothetical protein
MDPERSLTPELVRGTGLVFEKTAFVYYERSVFATAEPALVLNETVFQYSDLLVAV